MIEQAQAEVPVPGNTESQLSREYWKQYDHARKFDENARKDYVFCRRYARGDSSYDVSVNLLGTYVDILVAFLYARDPDLNIGVAESAGEERKNEIKLLAKTMTIVLSRAWKDAGMRRQAERWLRASLTTAIGWIKTGWQEEYETDPEMVNRRRDIQENLARIEALERDIEGGYDGDPELKTEELQAQLAGLEGHVEKLVFRGLFIDVVPPEDIQVSLDVQNVVDCEVATWIAHRSYLTLDQAKGAYPGIDEDGWGKVPRYHAIQPCNNADEQRKSAHVNLSLTHDDASNYSKGGQGNTSTGDSKYNEFIVVVEMWRGDTNQVCDLIEGLETFATAPSTPNVGTTRFYPFFPLALHEVDGERHPQSLVMRSYKLMDEYNRTRDKFKTLRQGIRPRMAFDARISTVKDMEKMMQGMTGEFIPVSPAVDGATVQQSMFEVPYPRIDPALFDLMPIKSELEALWGIQEALSSSISIAKTATEAQIQQAGTNARTGAMRERMEQVLTQIARYHAQIVIQKYELMDVRDIAGPEAIWPEDIQVEDLDLLLAVDIAAGSTGKPNTTAEREAWAATAGVIEKTIMQVSQLRLSPPEETARCLMEVMRETVNRAGDQALDIERFIPAPGQPVMLIDPQTLQPVMAWPAAPEQQPGQDMGGADTGMLAEMGGGDVNPLDAVAPTGRPDMIE